MTEPINPNEVVSSADKLTDALLGVTTKLNEIAPAVEANTKNQERLDIVTQKTRRFGKWMAALLFVVIIVLGGMAEIAISNHTQAVKLNQIVQTINSNAYATCIHGNKVRAGENKGWDNAIDSIVGIIDSQVPTSDSAELAKIAAGEAKQKAYYAKLYAPSDCAKIKGATN